MTLLYSYDKRYLKTDYFKYSDLLYYAYIKNIIKVVSLKKGSKVIDIGCGQGFFSNLFARCNMDVTGVDLSDVGIKVAREKYGHSGIKFISTDVMTSDLSEKYDCVFLRNFSLYNTSDIVNITNVTDKLIGLLKKGGIFIFIYNTRLKSGHFSSTWRYHTYNDIEKHFYRHNGNKLFIVNKVSPYFIGKYAFGAFSTRINKYLSSNFGFGVDIVCYLRA